MNTKKLLANKLHSLIKTFSTQLYIGWVLFIALITLLPGYTIPGIIDWNFLELDKIIHMTVFGFLTYLGGYSYTRQSTAIYKPVLLSFAVTVIYGLSIELLQTLIPQRGFDYADLTADVLGGVIGGLFFIRVVSSSYKDKTSNQEN